MADINNVEDHQMLPYYEVCYIQSMLSLTRSALAEIEMFHDIIKEIQNGKTENMYMILDNLQNFFTHSAALSRYFWPPEQKKNKLSQKRGERLRKAFAMADGSALQDRTLRNFIEHFDEKLDAYLEQGVFGAIVPAYVGARSSIGDTPSHFFRAYFIDEAVFKVLDIEYEVDPLIQEMVRVHNLLIDCEDHGNRIPPWNKVDNKTVNM